MREERPKGYPKLTREAYNFPPETVDSSDLIRQARDCECAPSNTDNLEGTYDEYSPCGSQCVEELDEDTRFYIQSLSSGSNPSVIRVFDACGGNPACFEKGDEVEGADVTGRILGLEDYEEVTATGHGDDPCSRSPCTDNGCQYLLFETCTTPVSGQIQLHTSVLEGFGVGAVVKYGGGCYQSTGSCSDTPFANVTQPAAEDITVIEEDGCDSPSCSCCSGVMDSMDILSIGIQERLELANSGSLPAVTGHDWSDEDYILNNPAEQANGDDSGTACDERYEGWRLFLKEIDYWLWPGGQGHLLDTWYLWGRNVSGGAYPQVWLDDNVYPDGEVAGLSAFPALAPHTTYENNIIQSGSGYDWFRNEFGTDADGIKFTIGGEGGFGTVDAARFGDSDSHVPVNSSAFCDLMEATVEKLMEGVTRLVAYTLAGSYTDCSGWFAVHAWVAYGDSCEATCAAIAALTPSYSASGPRAPRKWITSSTPATESTIERTHARVTANMTNYPASMLRRSKCYLYLGKAAGGGANFIFGQTGPVPFTTDSIFYTWQDAVPGGVWTSDFVAEVDGVVDPTLGTCQGGDGDGSGWQAGDPLVVLVGDFEVT